MTVQQLLQEKRDEIRRIAFRHGVNRVRVFGSVARGEARQDSDVDLLVTIGGATSPWFPGGLIVDLEKLLGKKVEVVTERALNPLIRESVLNDAVEL